jgi:hypothetical protein
MDEKLERPYDSTIDLSAEEVERLEALGYVEDGE